MSDSRLTTVYIHNNLGDVFATSVNASSSHDAAKQAVAFFLDDFWKGPKPKTGTVLTISAMGMDGPVKVRVREEWLTCYRAASER